MSEPSVPSSEAQMLCEKCRHLYAVREFQHGIPGQACVCRRCLRVMGYPVKEGA